MSDNSMPRGLELESTCAEEREAIIHATIRRLLGDNERLGIELQSALRRAQSAEDALLSTRTHIPFESKLALAIVGWLPQFITRPIRRVVALAYALRFS